MLFLSLFVRGIFLVFLPIIFAKNGVRRLQKSENCFAFNDKDTAATFNANVSQEMLAVSQEMLAPHNFRLVCDVYYGPITEYAMSASEFSIYHSRYLPFVLPCLKPGFVIYVQTVWLTDFMNKFYQQITVPFVLVTGGSDETIPSGIALTNFQETNSKIIHWYTTNCGINPDPLRFNCIMLGITDNNVWAKTNPDMFSVIVSQFSSAVVINKQHSVTHPVVKNTSYDVLIPRFNMGTHPDRKVVWEYLCGNMAELPSYIHKNTKNVTTMCAKRLSSTEMNAETIKSKFVVSPHGMGLDCYRTWESIYLGAYVIVKASTLDELYTDLPVLILTHWTDLTPDLLARTYERFSKANYSFDKLRSSYWYAKFRSHGYAPVHYKTVDPDMLKLQVLEQLHLKNGDLIMGQNKLVYLVANSTKCPISSLDIFMSHPGWDFGDVKHMTDFEVSQLFDGPPVEKL